MSASSSAAGGGGRARIRWSNGVWPEPFLEALALRLALDASNSQGRLAAAHPLLNIFQVCSTWRAVSRSDLLWQNLTRRVWDVQRRLRNTWLEEYVHRHRTASNFRSGRCRHATLHFVPTDNNQYHNNDGLSCRRLSLSDHHLAAGFSDGAVHLFRLADRRHLSTFYPQHRDRLGRFSSAVSGIILSDARLVFATLYGDIHIALVVNGVSPLRAAHAGDVVNNGALVDFSGCDRWWIGLYAGVPGRAFRIWNSETEELTFTGGTLTDPEAVMGWHLLTELTDIVARVRVTTHHTAISCTSIRIVVLDLQNPDIPIGEEEFEGGLIVGSFDANKTRSALIIDGQGAATVRQVSDLGEVCRFAVAGEASLQGLLGCVNGGYGMVCAGGVIRVWEIEKAGEDLYSFGEEVGDCNAMTADETYVAACSSDGTIHLWDFGA